MPINSINWSFKTMNDNEWQFRTTHDRGRAGGGDQCHYSQRDLPKTLNKNCMLWLRHTHTTYIHCDLETESAQQAKSVKTLVCWNLSLWYFSYVHTLFFPEINIPPSCFYSNSKLCIMLRETNFIIRIWIPYYIVITETIFNCTSTCLLCIRKCIKQGNSKL